MVPSFVFEYLHSEELEATGWALVLAQALLCLEFFLDILDAGLFAVVVVVTAVVMPNVISKVRCPVCRIALRRANGAVLPHGVA